MLKSIIHGTRRSVTISGTRYAVVPHKLRLFLGLWLG